MPSVSASIRSRSSGAVAGTDFARLHLPGLVGAELAEEPGVETVAVDPPRRTTTGLATVQIAGPTSATNRLRVLAGVLRGLAPVVNQISSLFTRFLLAQLLTPCYATTTDDRQQDRLRMLSHAPGSGSDWTGHNCAVRGGMDF